MLSFDNINVLMDSITQIEVNPSQDKQLDRVKINLYSIYILNYHVYSMLDDLEKLDHPVIKILDQISELINKIKKKEEQNLGGKDELGCKGESRKMTKEMMRNSVGKKRRIEENNPRLKNRKKAEKLLEQGKVVFEGYIDTKKSNSTKY